MDLPTRNTLSTLAPKQNDIKICDVMNESAGSSSNRTKVNSTGDILCTVNNNFVKTANNKFFNNVNNEFFNEIKSPSQLNTKNIDRVISSTDNTSDEKVLSESYLENVIQEFKTLLTNVEDF